MTRAVWPASALLLVPAVGRAASEAGHGPDWTMLALQVLNVGILGFLLYRYAGPFITRALRERSESLRSEIEAARSRLDDVEAENRALRDRLERLDAESGELVERAVEAAEDERARAVARAAQTAEHIGEEARRVADNEIERARQALREEAAELATRLAGEILRERITEDDDRRLVGEFVESVARDAGGES